ncbi:DUF1684 domain-containing protein [Aequorivita echinoideorum]|uniref:DUF1684 domain-containing protein n=1 Tax=Aequorivita echinoideorum TaxID=1549647 RepID=A0ABS5S8Q8_9FLAO|nr:DUF1684 domain-containing protein [Aequorivita echinoideorum]MBT0608260.1 DUF1684 domain-containing protein [Aequorivita echinoideorum]
MKQILLFSFLLISKILLAQNGAGIEQSKAAQQKLNEEFSNPETTILKPKDFKNFKGLEFYPISEKYIVEAEFVRTPGEKPFLMQTTTSRKPEYVKYGEAHFDINGQKLKLNLYKSIEPYDEPGYEDYLFLPFTDFTSGDGSYGGGRFIDLKIPEGETIVIDFNTAYNPYCAYNHRYSCPIPPAENDLEVRIEAGVKDFKKH